MLNNSADSGDHCDKSILQIQDLLFFLSMPFFHQCHSYTFHQPWINFVRFQIIDVKKQWPNAVSKYIYNKISQRFKCKSCLLPWTCTKVRQQNKRDLHYHSWSVKPWVSLLFLLLYTKSSYLLSPLVCRFSSYNLSLSLSLSVGLRSPYVSFFLEGSSKRLSCYPIG